MAVVQSGATVDQWTIDPTSKAGRVSLYDASGNIISTVEKSAVPAAGQGGVPALGKDRDTVRVIRTNRVGALEIPNRRLLLDDPIEGATLNTQRWTTTATTMTAAQAATGITLNASAITTINTGVLLTSRAQFIKMSRGQLHYTARVRSTLVANQVGEWGLAFMATLSGTTAQVENGAYWRFNSTGTVTPVLVFNSTEQPGTDISASLVNTNYYDWNVIVDVDRATFICTSTATGVVISEQVIRLPLAQQTYFAVSHLFSWHRVRNTGSLPGSAGQLLIGDTSLYGLEIAHHLDIDRQLAENNQSTSTNPVSYAQAAQFANSAAPSSASLSNTAAGYATLGGFFQFAAQATNNTDFCLFGFQVPAPYRLKIFSVRIDMWNTGAANVATPATTEFFALGLNGASANLNTGGFIRRGIGSLSIPISAAIGASAGSIEAVFQQPLVVEPGLFLSIIMRQISGAATGSQIPMGYVDVRGVFE
jgi:hypothetical protein